MSKRLVTLFCAATLVACSTTKTQSKPTPMVFNDCNAATNYVKSNNKKIGQGFEDNDATTIGTLELQNRRIVNSNLQCFPKMQEQIKHWEQMHKDMEEGN